MYKLICFDLDDTLWPCMPTIQFAEQTLYNWLAEFKPEIVSAYSIDQLRDKRKQLTRLQPELIHDLSAARRVHLKQLATETGDTDEWVETAFDVFYQARQQVTLFDDVLPVLSELKTRYTLVALTNGNAHISKTGLSDIFDFQISAADVQAAKPDPAMFYHAMEKAGVNQTQTLHVGDHPLHDIQGARNAGIDAVWIKRFDQIWDIDEPEVDRQFVNLHQLNDWLSASS
ncbi:MAG: HAD family hydrolase [endosymbiont of Galathealinum brachiosum]|uniref:HAD family hydrolase n=1 Tax=endosymbiont of Galathealinum brachiosum TaxID=2200906 RepID=A0A370DIQ4_9GAMM|nr:MAG: HAD family hydrolase [endosymbiont of Galathealinum brachiosum]